MKELKDYTIGEIMLMCQEATAECYIMKKHPDYPTTIVQEKCPMHRTAGRGCLLLSAEVPGEWDIPVKPLGEYSLKDMRGHCANMEKPCKYKCIFGDICRDIMEKAPEDWEI